MRNKRDLIIKICSISFCIFSLILFILAFYILVSLFSPLSGNIIYDYKSVSYAFTSMFIVSIILSLLTFVLLINKDFKMFHSKRHFMTSVAGIDFALVVLIIVNHIYNNSMLFRQEPGGWPYVFLSFLSLTLITVIVFYIISANHFQIKSMTKNQAILKNNLEEAKKLIEMDNQILNDIRNDIQKSIADININDENTPKEIKDFYDQLISNTNIIEENIN